MFCQKCGKEIQNEAVFCPDCGCPVKGQVQINTAVKPKKKLSKKLIALIVAAVILIALAIPTVMILTADKDLEASDLTKTSRIGAYFKFGIPTGSNSVMLKYDDGSVTLGGIKLNAFHVDFDEGEYVIMVDDEHTRELYDYLTDEFDESDIIESTGFIIIKAK